MTGERKYAYMIEKGDSKIGIMYHLGRYCVAQFYFKEDKLMTVIQRQFKTVSGAERYLLKDFSYAGRIAPNVFYATDKFIREGKYWKEDK